MSKSRNTNVRVTRTQSLERDKNNSKLLNDDHQSTTVSSPQHSLPKSSSARLPDSSIRKNLSRRSIRIIHPTPPSSAKSTDWDCFKASHLTRTINNSNIDPIRNIRSESSIHSRNEQIEHFQLDRLNNLSRNRSNTSDDRGNLNGLFNHEEIQNSRRQKKKRLNRFVCSPCCMIICALLTSLLLSAIIAIIVDVLSIEKTTTQITTSTSSISTTTTMNITIQINNTTNLSMITSTSSTTTTRPICGISCLNQTWLDDSSLFAKYKFENNYLDETKKYNGTGINNPIFVVGYSGQAVSFAFNASQMVSTSYIPLGNNSYSVDAWIYPTALINRPHNSICGICTEPNTDLCFHTTVRYTGSTYYLYHGFYSDDLNSNTKSILINEWVHTAFTFDVTTKIQTVYHNGILLRNRTANSPFLGMTGDFQIGLIENLTKTNVSNMFQGYIDELSVSGRVKSSCEILEQATLAARFHFDGSQPLLDYGPNSVPSIGSNYIIVSGHTQNAISFTSSSPSYFQATGFLPLGLTNQPFSISLWIKPVSLSGTLVHRSENSSGSGFCSTYLGFASNGSLIAQILTNTNYIGISYSNLSLITFSHIVQTWSSLNGLRLYVDNNLIGTRIVSTSIGNSAWINYLTIGNCLNGCGSCNSGEISPGQFQGSIDDLRIYTRELTSDDVCALYAYSS